jgi:biotin carboxyl carrier protein
MENVGPAVFAERSTGHRSTHENFVDAEEKMKLKAQLHDQDYELAVTFAGHRATVEIDGRSYDLEVHEPEDGSYLLFAGTRVYECRVSASSGDRETFAVNISRHSYKVTIIDPKRLRSAQSTDRHHHGSAEIVASMPGKVVRVLVEIGARVEAGSGIVVVEAMKMQNEMKAPQAGIVVSLGVVPGATVNAGDVLAVVSEEKG